MGNMCKIKVGSTVHYQGKPDVRFSVIRKIKGALTNKPNYQSGILFTGFKRKPTKFELSNGDIVFPHQLTLTELITTPTGE